MPDLEFKRPSKTLRPLRSLVISLMAILVICIGTFGLTLSSKWSPKLGLDLAGGLSVVYQPQGHPSQSDLNETVSILNNRVNALGVSGSQVSTQGKNIVVSVPGVSDARQVLAVVGQTAQLLFRPVVCYAPAYKATKGYPSIPYQDVSESMCTPAHRVTAKNLDIVNGVARHAMIPEFGLQPAHSTPPEADVASKTVLLPGLPSSLGKASGTRYLLGPSQLNGKAVGSAQAQLTQTGQWVVTYTLTPAGSVAWDTFSKNNFHQAIAVDLDGVVQSAPIIQPNQNSFTSFGGKGQISGNFTEVQAKAVANALKFGALPTRLVPLTTETISPSLGHSSLVAGLLAGVIGLILVLIYTVIYYRSLGLIIIAGLMLTAMSLWTVISALGHTSLAPSFSLAGVTGLIVSIGITVDSYIVYFERLKDETRTGRSVRTSVDRGFQSAWKTVLAADFISLLAAVILYIVAIGDVRGFAFFLGLSTILDIVFTYFFTRPLVMIIGRRSPESGGGVFSMSRGLMAKDAVEEGIV